MGNTYISDRDRAAAIRFADELNKYPVEVAVGVGLIIQNIYKGCSWSFVTENNEEFKNTLEEIKRNKSMSVFKIRGGYLLNMSMDYLLDILSKVATGYINQRDLQNASVHRQKALADLEKFIRKGGTGKIGIYNLNDTNSITVKGIRYPAFCVTLNDLLAICVRTGCKIKLGSKARTPGQVANHMKGVIEGLELAPSANALFIEITR